MTSATTVRYSIGWLMLITAACGVTAVALVNASILWASIFLSAALFVVAVAVTGAIFRKGGRRIYWIGFSLFGLGYLIMVYAPGFDRVVGHRLVVTKALGYLEPAIRRTDSEFKNVLRLDPSTAATSAGGEVTISLGPRENMQLPPQWGHFQQVGHSVAAIALACIGGAIARFFARSDTRERRGQS